MLQPITIPGFAASATALY